MNCDGINVSVGVFMSAFGNEFLGFGEGDAKNSTLKEFHSH